MVVRPPPPGVVPPPPPHLLALPPPHGGIAPELMAMAQMDVPLVTPAHLIEKKPRIYMLVTRLALELEESHIQQVLEQCGEVHAWRRGRDEKGQPLSFGFAQFGDPEAAWKASTCLSKKVLCGQEIKVLVEESADALIQKWRTEQQAVLKLKSEEELDWELERKAVSCKSAIDAKVEELYGPGEAGQGGGAATQRRQELREKETARVDRMLKRKTWRDEEFQKVLETIETAEKKMRKEEAVSDDMDRDKENSEDQDDVDLRLVKTQDGTTTSENRKKARTADNRQLAKMVDRVQSEPRSDLFAIDIKASFLRDEKVFETKLRPWLERKIDLLMGGPQSDLVEYILRRVNAAASPDSLIQDLQRYLDDNADPLTERMWRMLAFELMINGFALQSEVGDKWS